MHAAALLMLSSVNGSEHDSYMALAIWKATDTGWAVLADSEPMPTRLVCGCIAVAFTARVPAECMQPPC